MKRLVLLDTDETKQSKESKSLMIYSRMTASRKNQWAML